MKLKSLTIFLATLMSLQFSACVSTDVVDQPDSSKSDPDLIVLKIGKPETIGTRADDGYKLRYVAKIFKGSNAAAWEGVAYRQEIIEGEGDDKMVFKVEPDQTYGILVFADYIPSDYTADPSTGLYKDYFYNTASTGNEVPNGKRVAMRLTPGTANGNTPKYSKDFFNNPYYDAFFASEIVEKKKEEKIVDMELKRITAKVIFRDNSAVNENASIKIKKLGSIMYFDMNASAAFQNAQAVNVSNVELNYDATGTTEEEKDLFYFYTFASPNQELKVVSATFSVTTDTEGENREISEIPVRSNYKTIVKGEFLHAEPEIDEPDPEPEDGDLILNLSKDTSWELETLGK